MEEELTEIELNVVEAILDMKELKYPLPYDPEKLKYNSVYKCSDFFAKKFPTGWQSIPGFDKIIELCKNNATTPKEEIELRRFESMKEADRIHGIDVKISDR